MTQKTPLYCELLEFFDLQAQKFETVSFEWKLQLTTQRSKAVTVEEECMACGKGERHLLSTCDKFHGMLQKERWDKVRKGASAEVFETGALCKQVSSTYTCTLLHINADIRPLLVVNVFLVIRRILPGPPHSLAII